jgi:uncharacterized membrane protein
MQKLNTTAVYILSIVGFLCCCVYGLGTVAAIIALVIASKELKKFNANPDIYSNGKAMKTAKTVAIISLIISLIGLGILAAFYLNQCAFYEWTIEMIEQNPDANQAQLDQIYQAMEEAGCR